MLFRVTGSGTSWAFYDITDRNYLSANSKGLTTSPTSVYWTVSFSDGIPTATYSEKTLSPNLRDGYFGGYASVQDKNTLFLYKLDPVGISFPEAAYSMMIGSDEYGVFTGQTVTKGGSDTRTVTYS